MKKKTSRAEIVEAILREIDIEFQKQIPDFAKLHIGSRNRHIHRALREVMAQIKFGKKDADQVPDRLEIQIAFDHVFPVEKNTLFADKSRRLFLADTNGGSIVRGSELVPFEKCEASDFEEVSLKKALLWYVKCNPFASSSSGSVELLCEMAAEKL